MRKSEIVNKTELITYIPESANISKAVAGSVAQSIQNSFAGIHQRQMRVSIRSEEQLTTISLLFVKSF